LWKEKKLCKISSTAVSSLQSESTGGFKV
jgi:hypothetical protein